MALTRVAAGKMEPGVGNALASLSRALVATQQAGNLEDRLAELEALAGLRDHA